MCHCFLVAKISPHIYVCCLQIFNRYLRPGDLIQEYRLEMGTKFSSGPVKTLYEFWGETVTQAINDELTLQVKYLDHNLCAIKTDSSNQQVRACVKAMSVSSFSSRPSFFLL